MGNAHRHTARLKAPADYLDAIRAELALPSDYAAAKALQISKQTVSNYRLGIRTFNEKTAIRVAELLQVDPGKVLADMAAERSDSQRARVVWRRVAAALGSAHKQRGYMARAMFWVLFVTSAELSLLVSALWAVQ